MRLDIGLETDIFEWTIETIVRFPWATLSDEHRPALDRELLVPRGVHMIGFNWIWMA